MNNVILDHIDGGHFDRDLGELARDPQYSKYTALELKSVLADKIADNMLPEHHYGFAKVYAAIVGGLIVLLGIFITYN